jgi:hypothetical protein
MASHANFDTKGPVVLPRYSVYVPVEAPAYISRCSEHTNKTKEPKNLMNSHNNIHNTV